MKLFTRIAIAILISTIVPILLLFLVINGRITVADAMEDLMCSPVGHEVDYL